MKKEKKELIRKEGNKVYIDQLFEEIMKKEKAVLKALAYK